MYISIQQPEFFPWLGYFHKFSVVDRVIVLDNVQFKKRYFENRNKIRGPAGWNWLRVPVISKGRYTQLIKDVEIDQSTNWRRTVAESLRHAYAGAPYWHAYGEELQGQIHAFEGASLSKFNQLIISYMSQELGVSRPTQLASTMTSDGAGSELILNLCREAGASRYMSGVAGQDYLDKQAFRDAEIEVVYQNFIHPEYTQFHGNLFEPGMSAVDALFNLGPDASELISSK